MAIDYTNTIVLGAIIGAVATVVFFVVAWRLRLQIGRGTKIGVNLGRDLACPSCGAKLPSIRAPKNLRQLMWGGWTCAACGDECDKWLRPIPKDDRRDS